MDKQNITLSVPKDVLKKIKLIAVKRDTSISALLVKMMKELATSESDYEAARRRQIKLMREGLELGTYGKIDWDRDSLHERK